MPRCLASSECSAPLFHPPIASAFARLRPRSALTARHTSSFLTLMHPPLPRPNPLVHPASPPAHTSPHRSKAIPLGQGERSSRQGRIAVVVVTVPSSTDGSDGGGGVLFINADRVGCDRGCCCFHRSFRCCFHRC